MNNSQYIFFNSLNLFTYYHVVSRIMNRDISYRHRDRTSVLREPNDKMMMQFFVCKKFTLLL